MNPEKWIFSITAAVYASMWIGGVGSHLFWGKAPESMPWASPMFLILAGTLAILSVLPRDRWILLSAGVLGFLSEIGGVHTGLIFSGYLYTDVLGPHLFDVPVVMVCAWLVLIAYVQQMLLRFTLSRINIIILSALWMTAIDLVIDPLAAGTLGYWEWFGTGVYYGIPTHNFSGWFVVSAVVVAICPLIKTDNQRAGYTGLSIVLFFTAIAWIHGLVLAGIIGFGLCTIHILMQFKSNND